MLGTIVNTISIITGSLIGGFSKKGIKKEYEDTLFTSIGLCALVIGLCSFCNTYPNSKYPILFILSLSVGGLIGEIFDIDKKFNSISSKIGGGNFAKGFSTAILLFCIGTLSVLGPVQSAIYNNNTFLYTNSALDFVTSIILSSAYGYKIGYSAFVLFLWQGGIYIFSKYTGNFISEGFFNELMIVGGILIFCTGISILKIKEIKTMNFLPSILMVPIFYFLAHLFKNLLSFL